MQQGLTVEEVSKILKMRVSLIREVEGDDLRGFSHASYARLSLLAYGRFLRVPEEEILPWLPQVRDLDVEGHDYLNHMTDAMPEEAKARAQNPGGNGLRNRRSSVQIWLWFFGIVLILLLAWYAIVLIRKLERISPSGTVPAVVEEEVIALETEVSEAPEVVERTDSQRSGETTVPEIETATVVETAPEAETGNPAQESTISPTQTILPALPVEPATPVESTEQSTPGTEIEPDQPTGSDSR